MSEDLTVETTDFIAQALKGAQERTGHAKAICNINPKQWCTVAKHVLEDGLDIAKFNRKHGVKHWTYFKIRKELAADKDYDDFRNRIAATAAVSMEMGNDLEDRMTEGLMDRLDDFKEADVKEHAQALAQVSRSNSMRMDRFQKLTGATTQNIVVEHVVTQDEYDQKKQELRDKIAKAKQVREEKGEKLELDYTDEEVIEA